VQLAVRAFIDAAHADGGMTVPKGHKHPRQLAVALAARKLQDERERPLRGWLVGHRQIELRAASQLTAVRAKRQTRQQLSHPHAAARKLRSRARGDLQWATREPARSLAPDKLVKAHRKAVMLGHSAFAVSGTHLINERVELLAAGRTCREALMHVMHRQGRADLQQLGGQSIHALRDALSLLIAERTKRRKRALSTLKLILKLLNRAIRRSTHAIHGSARA
jgi:hypothetical protein